MFNSLFMDHNLFQKLTKFPKVLQNFYLLTTNWMKKLKLKLKKT